MFLTRFARVLTIVAALAGLSLLIGCTSGIAADRARYEGYQALKEGDLRTARLRLRDSAHMDPTNIRSQYYLARTALAQGDPLAAQRHLETIYAFYSAYPESSIYLQPRLPDLRVPWPSYDQIINALALAYYRADQQEQLIKFLRQVIEERGGKAKDYIRLARYLEKTGDHDGALVTYRKAVALAPPGDPDPYLALANFYESVGKREKALTQLRKAFAVAPDNPKIRARLRDYGVIPGPTAALPTE